MLGRLLEISLRTDAIQESLRFYEALGFTQAEVGEVWTHPYAVVTDGRLFLGLHAAPIETPLPTFVLPRLAQAIAPLEALGIVFEQRQLGDETFNQASFRDPGGQLVRLLEARTYSPPAFDRPAASACGYFSELGLPTRDTDAARAFWEPLGFVALQEEPGPFSRIVLASDSLNLALYRTRAFREPLLTFEDPHMRERIAMLRERGIAVRDEMPDRLDAAENGVLTAPEGTRLLLLQSEE